MAGLLVSVRSVEEARAAVQGGATVVDVKEPAAGPLGRAPLATWRAIRAVVPASIPVSVALGELADLDLRPDAITADSFEGIAVRKAGPARARRSWHRRWLLAQAASSAPTGWVAVIYADWQRASGPEPDEVVAAALANDRCPGVLVDNYDKVAGRPIADVVPWMPRVRRIQDAGKFVALAGRIGLADIHRLGVLEPDLFAVRGAACVGNSRTGPVDAHLVDRLARAAAVIRSPEHPGRGNISTSVGRPPASRASS